MQANSSARHQLTDEHIRHASPPVQPQLAFHLARPAPVDNSYSEDLSDASNMDSNLVPPIMGFATCPPRFQQPSSAFRRNSGGSLSLRWRTHAIEPPDASAGLPQNSLPNENVVKDEQNNTIRQFLRDLPNWLSGRSSTLMAGSSLPVEAKNDHGRRMKGEIVCLHYGSLDDAG